MIYRRKTECMSLKIKTEKSKKYIFYGMIMMIAIYVESIMTLGEI